MLRLVQGDCRKKLKEIEDNSIDTIITDPPYGLKFMGKKWDYEVPGVDLWEECLRVLKPGGTALIFAGSRTQHRMAMNIEDAGFILKDTLMWLYGSGFPKATDISKQIDKKFRAEREVIGERNDGIRKISNSGIYELNNEKSKMQKEIDITVPATPEAQLWDGYKSHGLKPAYEPIIMAMKLNEGSYAENALKWGVSGLNIDGGRIDLKGGKKMSGGCKGTQSKRVAYAMRNSVKEDNTKGRFPANILLDEEAAKMLDENFESAKGWGKSTKGEVKGEGSMFKIGGVNPQRYDFKTNPSRFFYVAKASKKERNMGCEGLEEKIGGGMSGTKDKSLKTGSGNERNNLMQNHHPTVKPLKLMEYLCTLTKTPTGGIVLDPFMGSGTTGMACVNTDRDFIGIELDTQYFEIAKRRIEGAQAELGLFKEVI